jgi:asparaginyl-tRNA synthetase
MRFFAERVEKTAISRLEAFVGAVRAHHLHEAVNILEKSGKKFEYPVKWGLDLQTEHERYLVEQHVGRPVVVMNYPEQIKAFYMRLNDDGRPSPRWTCWRPASARSSAARSARSGSTARPRMDADRPRPRALRWYRDLRRYGTVPHAGFGLGFERLVVYVCGLANIRDAIPYPRVPGSAEF